MQADSTRDLAETTRDALLDALRAFRAAGGDLRSPPERLRELLGTLAVHEMYQFVSVLTPDGTLLDTNAPALEAGGIEREEVVGRPFWEARWWTVSAETQRRVRDAVARAAAGEFVRYEVDVLAGAAGRELVTIDFSIRPVRDRAGRVVFLVPEGRNVTDRKAAELELARNNAELTALYERVKDLDATKTEFFANVSHELRTPLALVLGPIERLLAEAPLDPAQRHALEVADRNARTLLHHVNDLLDVSRLEAGAASLEWAELDLARVARLVASHFEVLATERVIRLRVDAPDTLPAQADPDKLERVLLNLVSNAFKFTPDGGAIRLSVAAGRGRVRIEVADSGPGIAAEHREAVFERFRQLDEGPARRFGGFGLGLAITRDFVRLHGGDVAIGDAPEGGALVVADLPDVAPSGTRVRPRASEPIAGAEPRPAVRSKASEAPEPPRASPDRPLVLVVEDNLEMNDFIRSALAPDFRTAAATSGEEGLARARALRPDLVLTDVMMPAMSGPDVVRALRAEPELASVPIVVLTAKADDALRARLLAGGAQDYVAKPVSVPELRARVGNLVRTKRARDVLSAELQEQAQDLDRLAEEVARRKRELQTALDSMRFAREQAERASAQKTSLMHLVSHELRTPLSALMLQVERLRREPGALSERQRDVVGRMRTATARLADLIESLLQYSRLDGGAIAAAPEPVDLAPLAAEVLEDLRPQAEQKQLELAVQTRGTLPPLWTDPRLLRLVLIHLVSNGIKFTERGGVGVTLDTTRGTHRVTVRDTGRGIAPEDQTRIFEPFEQLEALARKHTPGIGLGLTLVRELVHALGGDIAVESIVGTGSTFTVLLPSSGAAPRAVERPREPGAERGERADRGRDATAG